MLLVKLQNECTELFLFFLLFEITFVLPFNEAPNRNDLFFYVRLNIDELSISDASLTNLFVWIKLKHFFVPEKLVVSKEKLSVSHFFHLLIFFAK